MRQNLPVENQFKRHNGEVGALCLNELLTSMSIVVLICIDIFLIPIHSNITKRSGYVQECGLEFTQNSQSERSAYQMAFQNIFIASQSNMNLRIVVSKYTTQARIVHYLATDSQALRCEPLTHIIMLICFPSCYGNQS